LSDAIETILGHRFTRPELLREALTHRSALQGSGRARGSNERLEFVGDRVLGLLMAEWLAERFPREQEGDLGRRLAYLVSQPVLASVAEGIGLGGVLSVAPGEARAGVKRRATVLADALEAALGAVYYDAGLDAARGVVRRAWDAAMVAQVDPPKDAKTTLQEWAQRHTRDLPVYRVVARSGPPHAPEFTVAVQVGGVQGMGTAGSKRVAEQFAAADLLQTMAKGTAPGASAKGTGPETAAKGPGLETPAKGTGPATAAKGTGPETAAKGTGPETAAKETGPETAAKGTGPETTAKGTGPEAAAKGTGPAAVQGAAESLPTEAASAAPDGLPA
jgi:ribonuclease-3